MPGGVDRGTRERENASSAPSAGGQGLGLHAKWERRTWLTINFQPAVPVDLPSLFFAIPRNPAVAVGLPISLGFASVRDQSLARRWNSDNPGFA